MILAMIVNGASAGESMAIGVSMVQVSAGEAHASAVTVCAVLLLFVQVTVAPAATTRLAELKLKLVMATELALVVAAVPLLSRLQAIIVELAASRTINIAETRDVLILFVKYTFKKNDQFQSDAIVGGRLKLTHRLSLTADFFYDLNNYSGSGRHNALAVGVDIETGGHVFQLHVTNATGMNERSVIADTNYDWGKGEIAFGFNLSRSFNLKKNKKIVFN